jgi:GTPase Era involved in 16S rRNA processing
MEQLSRDVSEVILLESLNAQRIDRLNESMGSLRDTIRDSIAQFSTSLATQSQAMSGFRELYAREIAYIHQTLNEVKHTLDGLKDSLGSDKDKINAVEKDIAVARGSIKGAVVSWSGFVALVAFVIDKAVELLGKK